MSLVQRIEKLAAQSISKIPTAMARRLGSPIVVDGQSLDPHLKIMLGINKSKGGFETLRSVAEARAAYRHIIDILERPEPPAAVTCNRTVDTDAGPVPIRIYEPSAPGPRPCVIYFHGGGYVIGDLDSHDGLCRRFCRELEATVVAVDYRLAPEARFPAGTEDCIAVTRWVVKSAPSLDIDPDRIALAGDSAGGNFAAVVSQEVSGIAFQLLIYPGTDARHPTPSKELFSQGFGLDKATIDWFFAQYCDEEYRDDPRVSPAASKRLGSSPPTHIATAGFDVLRDEGRAFGQLLQEAGIACSIENHSSLSHGFVHFTRLPGCNEGVEKLVAVLRRGLEPRAHDLGPGGGR